MVETHGGIRLTKTLGVIHFRGSADLLLKFLEIIFMADGKVRHSNHIIDSRAIQFIQNKLPVEWVTRQMHPDYGIDLDLELFGYENEKYITHGEHVFFTSKGNRKCSTWDGGIIRKYK